MCAGAIVQSRIPRVVYGAADPKAGACDSLFRLVSDPRLNHRAAVTAGVLERECGEILSLFFQDRRGFSKLKSSQCYQSGGVPEWLKGPVSKTGVPLRGTVGLNPTSSATRAVASTRDDTRLSWLGLGVDFQRLSVPTEADHIKGVKAPGRYDAMASSQKARPWRSVTLTLDDVIPDVS